MNNKKIDSGLKINILGQEIKQETSLKYLGVNFEKSGFFKEHVERVTKKGIRVAAELARFMANIGGPMEKNRRIYYKIVESVVLYAAPIWAKAIQLEVNRKKLGGVQKIGLARIVRAYRTVSTDALEVMTGIMPIDLKIRELAEIQKKKKRIRIRRRREIGQDPETEKRRKEREQQIIEQTKEELEEEWQQRWDCTQNGRWTNRIIRNIKEWKNRKFGNLNYYTTQIMSGHGCFNSFRKRIGKSDTDLCWYGCGMTDDAEHTMFHCERWALEREKMIDEAQIEI